MKFTYQEDVASNTMTYTLEINAAEYIDANLTDFDYALIHDIEHGKPSNTPIADQLLGLETIARRIEEAAPVQKDGDASS